jgi:hypothetical protein
MTCGVVVLATTLHAATLHAAGLHAAGLHAAGLHTAGQHEAGLRCGRIQRAGFIRGHARGRQVVAAADQQGGPRHRIQGPPAER